MTSNFCRVISIKRWKQVQIKPICYTWSKKLKHRRWTLRRMLINIISSFVSSTSFIVSEQFLTTNPPATLHTLYLKKIFWNICFQYLYMFWIYERRFILPFRHIIYKITFKEPPLILNLEFMCFYMFFNILSTSISSILSGLDHPIPATTVSPFYLQG